MLGRIGTGLIAALLVTGVALAGEPRSVLFGKGYNLCRAASLSATGDVSVSADSATKARATTSNDTGGFVGIGKTYATTDQSSTTEAYVGANTSIGAGGDVSSI